MTDVISACCGGEAGREERSALGFVDELIDDGILKCIISIA
jgi:hypothetical protein